MWKLTKNAIPKILHEESLDDVIVQVLALKKMGNGDQTRHRVLLSDGANSYSSVMLGTQCNHLVEENRLVNFSVIKVTKQVLNVVADGRTVVILLEFDILENMQDRIGEPSSYKFDGSTKMKKNGFAPASRTDSPNGSSANASACDSSSNPGTPSGAPARVFPINSLNPYQNRWTIRARVVNKAPIRTWSNARGEGTLFNMLLQDDSGEIRATAFKEQVDKFYDMLEVNKVYYFSRAVLKSANKQYNNTNSEYEMTFTGDTSVVPCDDDSGVPEVSYQFTSIGDLNSIAPQSFTDIVAIVKETAELSRFTSQNTNREVTKRDLQLVDESKVIVRCTLWGSEAERFESTDNPVVVIKGAKVSNWNGRSLSVSGNSQFLINPNLPEANKLKQWFTSTGTTAEYSEYQRETAQEGNSGYETTWKTFEEVKSQNIGQSADKAEYFTQSAALMFLRKENCLYSACPSESCNKKVIDTGNGFYRCEKCQQDFPNFKYRLILSAHLVDETGQQWVTLFQESAEKILGITGQELGDLREQNQDQFDKVFDDALWKRYIFKMRAKTEVYNEESRVKVTVLKIDEVDPLEETKRLMSKVIVK